MSFTVQNMSCRDCEALQWKESPWDFRSAIDGPLLRRHLNHLHACTHYANNYLIFILKYVSSNQIPWSSPKIGGLMSISSHKINLVKNISKVWAHSIICVASE